MLINEDDESFESLMTIADGMKPPKESKQPLELVDQDKVLDTRRQAALQQEISKKERANLERPITRDAFIKFKSYESKLEMMDTALFLFGMKLHN